MARPDLLGHLRELVACPCGGRRAPGRPPAGFWPADRTWLTSASASRCTWPRNACLSPASTGKNNEPTFGYGERLVLLRRHRVVVLTLRRLQVEDVGGDAVFQGELPHLLGAEAVVASGEPPSRELASVIMIR